MLETLNRSVILGAYMTNEKWISSSVGEIRLSAIKEMAMRASALDDVVSLAWGLPSFRTPEPIRQAVTEALASDPDVGKYALPNGLAELRQRVAEHHHAETGVAVDPDQQVFITAGNMQGMSSLLRATLEPGDEVIVTDPGFASHVQQISLCGGVPVFWSLDESQGWRLDVEALVGLMNERTKALVLVSPSNPTGTVFTESELKRVGEIARASQVLLFLDDPYSKFSYVDDSQPYNLAAQADLGDQLAYLFTFSKCHAMSGWRLGYIILPDWLRAQVLKVHDANMICAPRISQLAGLAALSEGAPHIAEFRRRLIQRRTLICERLDRLPQLFEYIKPQGAYYVFPRIVPAHKDSVDFSIQLLEKVGVAVTPGSAFGPCGEHHVRLAFCADEDTINMAFDRLEAAYGLSG
jgi:aspartate/methionine/tyrosine aminotransferase